MTILADLQKTSCIFAVASLHFTKIVDEIGK
jgi:hypothetical protein